MKSSKILTILVLATVVGMATAPANAQYVLSGRVYSGEVGDQSTPLSGVTVELYCSGNPDEVGVRVDTTTTDDQGWYGLTAPDGCEYYNIVQAELPDYTFIGATSVDGTVKDRNWIQYVVPLGEKTLTGNKFWERPVSENQAPIVDAGHDVVSATSEPLPRSVGLGGSVTDDGQPVGQELAIEWSVIDSPLWPEPAVDFEHHSDPETIATFYEPGIYVLRLAAFDGELQAFDDVTIEIIEVPEETCDLVGHWPLDEGGGLIAHDISGNENHGTLVGNPFWVGNEPGHALCFDGENYVEIPNNEVFDITDAITVAAWIKVEVWDRSWQGIFCRGAYSWRLQRNSFEDMNNESCSFHMTGMHDGWGANGTVSVSDGEWYHVAGTWDGSRAKIYFDGVLDDDQPRIGSIGTEGDDPVTIGAQISNGVVRRAFKGCIDEVRIYDCALEESAIGQLHAMGERLEILSGPTVQEVSQDSAFIFWETSEDSDSVVKYDKKAGVYNFQETGPALVKSHNIPLTGLAPSTTYHLMVQSTDLSGNTAESKDITFETPAKPDAENPIIAVLDPGLCTGTVEITAEADDNEGLEKVEFYVGDVLVFTDYSAPYGFSLDSTEYMDGQYNFKAKAVDISGKVSWDDTDLQVDNPPSLGPAIEITYPHTDGQIVFGNPINITAKIESSTGLISASFHVYSGNTSMHQDGKPFSYPWPTEATVEFPWNTYHFKDGNYRLIVQAFDTNSNITTVERQVTLMNVVVILPPTVPSLSIGKHTAKRHGNYLEIELEVKNDGEAKATKVVLVDFLQGFQPISKSGSKADYTAYYDPQLMRGRCQIQAKADFLPGESRVFSYLAVPILLDKIPTWKSVTIGDVMDASWESTGGTKYVKTFKGPISAVTADSPGLWPWTNETISEAHEEALGEANYLIATNAYRLATTMAPNWYQTADFSTDTKAENKRQVNMVLSNMAKLARYKHGVLGYVHKHNKDHLRDLIKPKGAWAKKLHPAFSKVLGGYFLIVGETEIVPTSYTDGWGIEWSDGATTEKVWHTDELYASTTGSTYASWDPELAVGRIIGNDPCDLSNAIETSIDEYTGSLDFNYSHALAVSGTNIGQGTMVASVDTLQKSLNGITPKVPTTKIHWKDYTTKTQRRDAFFNAAGNKDLIYFNCHGLPKTIGALDTAYIRSSIDFKGTAPVVFGTSCLTGCYEKHRKYDGGDDSIGEAFLDKGAGVYIGSTEVSSIQRNGALGKMLFPQMAKSAQSRALPVGWHLTSVKRSIWAYGRKYRFWACEYNLYGDPKFGTTAAPTTTKAASSAKSMLLAEPAEAVQVTIPDYQVSTIGNVDYVEIPGGAFLLEDGQPQVPCYAVELDYPAGCQVQEVVLAEKGGELRDTGLKLPIVVEEIAALQGTDDAATGDSQGWYPSEDYRWHRQRKPDGSTTLVIVVYPFFYDAPTTNVKFYRDYSFAVDYVVTDISITSLASDAHEYQQGELVTLDLELANSGETQDVVVSVVVKEHGGLSENVDGLLLETLKDFSGQASFSPQWDSSGFQPGYYAVEATLKDTSGNMLDRSSDMFRLGIPSGEITEFTATPEYVQVGDDVTINMIFENTGTVNITGYARIKVVNSTGDVIDEFVHDVNDLLPSESVSFTDIWNASEAGPCSIMGYVLYDSKSTDPAIVEINKECFPSDYSTYNDWVVMGKPDCWCWPYQCDGDADGGAETFFNYRIYGKDLGLIVDNWKRKIDDPLLDPCADIDHKSETFFNYRVYGKDLAKVVANWKKKDAELAGDCPRAE